MASLVSTSVPSTPSWAQALQDLTNARLIHSLAMASPDLTNGHLTHSWAPVSLDWTNAQPLTHSWAEDLPEWTNEQKKRMKEEQKGQNIILIN